MENFVEILKDAESIFVQLAIVFCDFVGVIILLVSVVKCLLRYFHHDAKTKLFLARGIALALEFKLAAEVLRTVTVRTWNELAILGVIILIRAAISVLIHWELKVENDDDREIL